MLYKIQTYKQKISRLFYRTLLYNDKIYTTKIFLITTFHRNKQNIHNNLVEYCDGYALFTFKELR